MNYQNIQQAILNHFDQQQDIVWHQILSMISSFSWAISMYGQVYTNYKLKSVESYCLDYFFLNSIGYSFYVIYTSLGYFTDMQGAGTVLIGDLLFAYHAIPVSLFTLGQCFYYPIGKNKVSKQALAIGAVLWAMVLIELFFTQVVELFKWTQFWNPLSVVGYGKLTVSLIKYSPPVYHNFKRKSTVGWSIFRCILDLIGGFFSFISALISTERGLNMTKLLLGLLSICYNIIFVLQHYVLYKKKDGSKLTDQKQSLISNEKGSLSSEQQITIKKQSQTDNIGDLIQEPQKSSHQSSQENDLK